MGNTETPSILSQHKLELLEVVSDEEMIVDRFIGRVAALFNKAGFLSRLRIKLRS